MKVSHERKTSAHKRLKALQNEYKKLHGAAKQKQDLFHGPAQRRKQKSKQKKSKSVYDRNDSVVLGSVVLNSKFKSVKKSKSLKKKSKSLKKKSKSVKKSKSLKKKSKLLKKKSKSLKKKSKN
jgi:hypothetical protein